MRTRVRATATQRSPRPSWRLRVMLSFVAPVLLATGAPAATHGLPSAEGLSGGLRSPRAAVLPHGGFSLGVSYDFEIEKDHRHRTDTDLHVLGLSGGFGLFDRLELSVLVPFVFWELDDGPGERLPDGTAAGVRTATRDLGDVTVGAKLAVLTDGSFDTDGGGELPVDVSVVAGYRIGTGRIEARTAEGSLEAGESLERDVVTVGLLGDWHLGLGEARTWIPGPLTLSAGVGGEFPVAKRSEAREEIESSVSFLGGASLPLHTTGGSRPDRLVLEGSVRGRSDPLAGERSPVRLFTGLRYELGNGLGLGGGLDAALTSGIDDYRGLLQLAWSGPRPAAQSAPPAASPERMGAGTGPVGEAAAPVGGTSEVAPAPEIVEREVVRERIVIPDVNFDFDKSDLGVLAEGKLRLLVKGLASNPADRIIVEGHADERGSEAYNVALGRRRAEAVRSRLVALGVPAEIVKAVSIGESRPLLPETEAWAWAVNRRVEVVIDRVKR